ncbi:MAG: class I SAM-dependent methyltransferase [Candidatus Poribacteria bacterium]|nr:class I SAM-dependent methyltransferase [Candidatus Poribacteria bacterium]
MSLSIHDLNTRHFAGRLSAPVLDTLSPIDRERPEVRAFTERAFRQMRAANFRAEDFTTALAHALSRVVPNILPGAWTVPVPPITATDRNRLFDEYLAHRFTANPTTRRLLDIGCGFPPHTTLDSAQRLADWQIVGADPLIPDYLVTDNNGDYAAFNAKDAMLYFQSSAIENDRWNDSHADRRATEQRFITLARDINRRTLNPIAAYERNNLRFVQAGIGEIDEPFDAIRCLNVLYYFDRAFRVKTLAWVNRCLNDGGVFLCGATAPNGSTPRYTVYRKEGETLVDAEFAMSIESILPTTLIAWYTMYDDDDTETRRHTNAMRLIRSDNDFTRDHAAAFDALLSEYGCGGRSADGYLHLASETMPQPAYRQAMRSVAARLDEAGYVDRAIETLKRAGIGAWRNAVDNIAMTPCNALDAPIP